ncbi:MFS general substrate transporter [Chloropicon primus]|uniref:MFS general substrate transporter n=1 Tax=Chloropicon primus TaxID=1764295 RepID=A0A5B8MMM1_9CHLO|nr:MFS general substrate transporter [Chloropicon primus]UPR01129.1 MFS general substrate transporter [Chloropicon primus]|eukprot:QDZ21908.1 MFS general substrate transporter [Chloropicon primus]
MDDKNKREEGGEEEKRGSAWDYPRLLIENRNYLAIFCASVFQQLGNWANLIASMKIVEEVGVQTGFNAGLIFFLRQIPYVLLFPIAGACADKFDRKTVMIVSNGLSCLVAGSFVFLTMMGDNKLGMLCVLIFLKNSASSFYSPCKRAAVPMVVSRQQLHIAMTMDGIAWSSMLAVGAALGGLMTSQLGLVNCFLLDSLGFVLSITCLLFLPRLKQDQGNTGQVAGSGEDEPPEMKRVDSKTLKAESSSGGAKGGFIKDTLALFGPSHRVSLLYCTMKATGGLIWGPADVLNLKWSEIAKIQINGDQPLTLGFAYAFVGVGCFVGPPLSNVFFGKEEAGLIRAILFGIGCLTSGYACWSFAFANFTIVMLGNLLRSAASAVIWIKSTLLIQLYSDARFLGRLFALELAFYTIANSLSMFAAGLLLDNGVLDVRKISASLLLLSVVMFAVWVLLVRRKRGEERSPREDVEYEMVSTTGDE